MKKTFLPILLLFTAFLFVLPSAAEPISYQNPDSGISFTLPDGWVDNSEKMSIAEYSSVCYFPAEATGESIQYAYLDLWSTSKKIYQLFNSRSSINNDVFTDDELIKEMKGLLADDGERALQSSTRTTIGSTEYRQFLFQLKRTGTEPIPLMKLNIHIKDGICHYFVYGHPENVTTNETDFTALMESANFSAPALAANDKGKMALIGDIVSDYLVSLFEDGAIVRKIPGFLLAILLTLLFYCLPMLVYRYAFVKKPLPKKKARRIVIIYGILLFLIDTAATILIFKQIPLSLPAAVLWSIVNYRILSKGLDRTESGYAYRVEQTMKENSDALLSPPTVEEPPESGYFPKNKTVPVVIDPASRSKGTAVCPGCGKQVDVILYQSIDCSKDLQLKKDALTGLLFQVICPACGSSFRTEYPLFYLDKELKLVIRLLPGDERESLSSPSLPELSGFQLRLVTSLNELIEKLCLYEDGFDDKTIEYCKSTVLPGVKRSFPDNMIGGLYFRSEAFSDELEFQVISGDDVISTISIGKDAYQNAFSLLHPHFDKPEDGLFLRIDSNWIHSPEGKKIRQSIAFT